MRLSMSVAMGAIAGMTGVSATDQIRHHPRPQRRSVPRHAWQRRKQSILYKSNGVQECERRVKQMKQITARRKLAT